MALVPQSWCGLKGGRAGADEGLYIGLERRQGPWPSSCSAVDQGFLSEVARVWPSCKGAQSPGVSLGTHGGSGWGSRGAQRVGASVPLMVCWVCSEQGRRVSLFEVLLS